MSEPTSRSWIQSDCEALNAFAGRKIETVDDLATLADERGMKPHEVFAAARRHDDLQVELAAESETTEQVSCLVVPAGFQQRNARLTTFDIFQDGERAQKTRLVITDTDGHDAWLDLAPESLKQVGEWCVREAQRLRSAGREQVPA